MWDALELDRSLLRGESCFKGWISVLLPAVTVLLLLALLFVLRNAYVCVLSFVSCNPSIVRFLPPCDDLVERLM